MLLIVMFTNSAIISYTSHCYSPFFGEIYTPIFPGFPPFVSPHGEIPLLITSLWTRSAKPVVLLSTQKSQNRDVRCSKRKTNTHSQMLHGAGICKPTFARTKSPSFVGFYIPAPWSIWDYIQKPYSFGMLWGCFKG